MIKEMTGVSKSRSLSVMKVAPCVFSHLYGRICVSLLLILSEFFQALDDCAIWRSPELYLFFHSS